MIRLDTDTRKLQALLAGAPATTQPDVMVSYRDVQSGLNYGRETCTQLTPAMTGATPVDVCDAPGRGVYREVDGIVVRNNDSASVVATVRLNDNGTAYPLVTFTLAVGDILTYAHGLGWRVVDLYGNLRQ
jgi:hypothetical protein